MTLDEDDPLRRERGLILSYAPSEGRDALAALLALDDTLGDVLRTTREALVGQMRLTWWHDALSRLDGGTVPAQPVLQALARHTLPHADGTALAAMVEGWEALLDVPLDHKAILAHAEARGERLFRLAARCLRAPSEPRLADIGRGWALSDLSRHLSDPALTRFAAQEAGQRLRSLRDGRWHRRLRALSGLAHLARMDLAGRPQPAGHPARALRLLWHRSTGR